MSTLTISGLEALLQKLGLETPIPSFEGSDVLNKPLDIAHCYLSGILPSLAECDSATAYKAVTCPSNIDNGDLAVIVPKLSHGRNPKEVGFEIDNRFQQGHQDHPLFILFSEGVQLRIFLKEETFPRICLPYIVDRADSYGRNTSLGRRDSLAQDLARKRVIVEFSSPNIASEFQGKHLRSTILGAFIANLHEAMGWDVVRMNYLGDWGKPIGLLGVGWDKFGSEVAFEADSLGHLMEVYHKIHELFKPELDASKRVRGDAVKKGQDDGKEQAEIESQGLFAERNAFFKRMEEGEENALALWERVRTVNIENYIRVYARLGIKFDEYSGESQVSAETMAEVEDILKSKDLLSEEGEGLLTVDLKKYKLGAGVIRDRVGSSTYLLRDLAAVLERDKKYSFDKMIYVVAADHNLHFRVLIKILDLMGKPELANKLEHISFSESVHMFDKLGDQNHALGDIIDRCQATMAEALTANKDKAATLDNTEPPVAVGALLAQEMSARRSHDHAFDIDRMTSFASGTGPDLSWWLARLNGVAEADLDLDSISDEDWASIEGDDEVNLLRLLVQWPDVVQSAYKALEPSVVLGYLVNLTSQLSSCFKNLEETDGAKSAQKVLFHASLIVLKNGLRILGILSGTFER